MDQVDWVGWLSVAANLVLALCAVTGFGMWRREQLGKRQIEVAEQVLAGFHRAKTVLDYVRSPWAWEHEGNTHFRPGDLHRDRKGKYAVPLERINRHREILLGILDLKGLAEIYLGPDVDGPFRILASACREVWHSADMLKGYAGDPEEGNEEIRGLKKKWEDSIWSSGASDPLDARLQEAIAGIGHICRPYIPPPRDTSPKRFVPFLSLLCSRSSSRRDVG